MKFRNIYQKELICLLWQGDSAPSLKISPRVHLEDVSFPEIPLSFMITKDPPQASAVRTPAPGWSQLPISIQIIPGRVSGYQGYLCGTNKKKDWREGLVSFSS